MIPLYKVFMPERVSEGIGSVLESGHISYGTNSKLFESKLQSYIGNKRTLTVSGNSVLFALRLIGISKDDEVIVSPMSCLMTTQPINYCGAKIIWADIDPRTGSLDPDDVRRKVSKRTKAIIHYHWGGVPGYIQEINQVAKEHGVTVIEDASEAFGASYNGGKIGNNGSDIVCFSFTPVRLPNALDGGGVAFSESKLFEKAKLKRDLGINRAEFRDNLGEISEDCDIFMPAESSLMNDVSGFVGSVQMDYLDSLFEVQRNNAEIWKENLKQHVGIQFLREREGVIPSYWVFTFLTEDRESVLESMRKKGFYASKLHMRNDLYSVFGASCSKLTGVDAFSQKQLNIPCGWWFNLRDIDYEI